MPDETQTTNLRPNAATPEGRELGRQETTSRRSERAFGIGVALVGLAMITVGSLLLLPRDGGPALLIGMGSIAMSLGINHWRAS